MNRNPDQARVFLVGAGPGDPGLLTLRALECLGAADLVLFDKLVPKRLLDFAPQAEAISVADLPGGHPNRWPRILECMREAVSAGKVVVRLKGGDPLIFGRGLEEAEFLRAAGIRYEIVPGITAALATAAAAEVPLTHRGDASAVAFVTGHENPTRGDSVIDWSLLARFPGTIVIYMGLARLEFVAATLVSHGLDPATPATVVSDASTPDQRRVRGPLCEISSIVRNAGLTSPALVLIGAATSRSPEKSWLERRPLFGSRILVTRPRGQSGELVRKLELLGSSPQVLPAVEILPLEDWQEVDRRLDDLPSYDWLVFTSVNGVAAFLNRLMLVGRDLRALGKAKLAAIGPKTAAALEARLLVPDVIPASFRSESLAESLLERVAGQRVLLVRADRGREVLRDQLSRVAEVDQIAVYRQIDSIPDHAPAFDSLRRGEIDIVTLTSANIARAFLRSIDDVTRGRIQTGQVKLATISPVTTAAVAEFGLTVAAEAKVYTMDGLVEAIRGIV